MQYKPQGVIKTDKILKYNAVFAVYGICNVNLKTAIRLIKFHFEILTHDMSVSRRKRPLHRKIALLAKMAFPSSGTLLRPLTKPVSLPITL